MVRPSRCVPVLACLAALAGAPLRAEDAISMAGAAAWQKLVGNTVVAKTGTGATYTDYYGPDGTVRHQDGDGATTGRWSQEGDGVCFDYPDDDERTCVTVRLTGATGTFVPPDGGPADTFDILPGDAKGL